MITLIHDYELQEIIGSNTTFTEELVKYSHSILKAPVNRDGYKDFLNENSDFIKV